MPIEIREIIIRATVNQAESPGAGGSTPASGGAAENPNSNPLQECVEQVMQILQDKNQR